MGQQTREVE